MKEGSIVLIDQGFLSISTFLTFILLAKATSKEELGLYVLGWSTLNIALSFTDGLVTKPFTIQLLQCSANNKTSYLGNSLIQVLALSTIGGIFIFPIFLFKSNMPQIIDHPVILSSLIVLALYAYLARNFIRNATLAYLRVYQGAMSNIFGSVLHIFALMALFSISSLNIYTVYIALAASCLVATLSLAYYQSDIIHYKSKNLVADFRYNWVTGRWLLTNAFSSSLTSYASPWLIVFFIDTGSVAVFGACQSLAAVSNPLLRGINSYLLPRMTHGLAQSGEKMLLRILWLSTKIILLPFLVWTTFATLFADYLLETLYSEEYTGNALLLSLLLIRTMIESAGSPVTNALQTLGKARLTTVSAITGALITITGGPFLIYKLGITGAGLTVLAATCVMTTLKWFWILKHSQKNIAL